MWWNLESIPRSLANTAYFDEPRTCVEQCDQKMLDRMQVIRLAEQCRHFLWSVE